MTSVRARADRCPGALRPWPATDGLLVRLRLIGGAMSGRQLLELSDIAATFADGRIHVTQRANLQVRGFAETAGGLEPAALHALRRTGLLPAPSHELVRNVMISPRTGHAGGRADLRPVGRALDERLCGAPELADLPGRFLFVLDDGRGDLRDRPCDLGLVALDSASAQLRVGEDWGEVVALGEAADRLSGLARHFLRQRGSGPAAPWHVRELGTPLADRFDPDPCLPAATPLLPYGVVPGGRHVEVPVAGLDDEAVRALTAGVDDLVVTPWRGIFLPGEGR